MVEFKLKKEFTDEVITHTIMFEDTIVKWLFLEYFGIKPEADNPKRSMQIERFSRYFMDPMGYGQKLNLLKEVLKDRFPEIILPKNFESEFVEFYKIRNIFAHSMFPREVNQKTPYVSLTGSWEELAKRHKELYRSLATFTGVHTARFN